MALAHDLSIEAALYASPPAREIAIRADNPDGFDILVFCDEKGVRVSLGGLEFDFDTIAEAAEWVKCALSDTYRLRIDFIDKRPYRWALEQILSGQETQEVLVSGYTVSRRLLQKKRTVYRQNRRYKAVDLVSVQVH